MCLRLQCSLTSLFFKVEKFELRLILSLCVSKVRTEPPLLFNDYNFQVLFQLYYPLSPVSFPPLHNSKGTSYIFHSTIFICRLWTLGYFLQVKILNSKWELKGTLWSFWPPYCRAAWVCTGNVMQIRDNGFSIPLNNCLYRQEKKKHCELVNMDVNNEDFKKKLSKCVVRKEMY